MFDDLAALADDPERLFNTLAERLAAAGELHRLFDLRLLEQRRRLGLPLDRRTPIDEVEEPLRSQLEAAYLAACREVGELFLAGRPAARSVDVPPPRGRQARRCAGSWPASRPTTARADELIELALYEGVDPERGYAWLLGRQGTCNAITTLDGLEPQLRPADLKACAAVLVRHVYEELRGNLAGHLHRLAAESTGAVVTLAANLSVRELSVRELTQQHPELQARGDYHLDASHLASTMRYARLLTDPALVTKALEMAEYGTRLPAELQYPGESPFEDLYSAHRLYFQATLGREVDAALDLFAACAKEAPKPCRTPLSTFRQEPSARPPSRRTSRCSLAPAAPPKRSTRTASSSRRRRPFAKRPHAAGARRPKRRLGPLRRKRAATATTCWASPPACWRVKSRRFSSCSLPP